MPNSNITLIELRRLLRTECSPFFNSINIPLFRGTKTPIDTIIAKKPIRSARKPIHSSETIQQIYDVALEDFAGFKPRSNALFTSTSETLAGHYGTLNLIFPINEFKYIYLDGIGDLYNEIGRLVPGGESAESEVIVTTLQRLARNTNLRSSHMSADPLEGIEVNINNTDGYYAVNINRACDSYGVTLDELIRTLFK